MATKSAKAEHYGDEHELVAIVVEEVDEAREVLELARQLVHALPLHTFEDVVKAVGPKGTISFRGRHSAVANFAGVVPGVLFPIDSVHKLVTLLYETVRLAPPSITYSDSDPAHAKRKLRRLGLLGLRQGSLGRRGPLDPYALITASRGLGTANPQKGGNEP
jgi:hypothetical protein